MDSLNPLQTCSHLALAKRLLYGLGEGVRRERKHKGGVLFEVQERDLELEVWSALYMSLRKELLLFWHPTFRGGNGSTILTYKN